MSEPFFVSSWSHTNLWSINDSSFHLYHHLYQFLDFQGSLESATPSTIPHTPGTFCHFFFFTNSSWTNLQLNFRKSWFYILPVLVVSILVNIPKVGTTQINILIRLIHSQYDAQLLWRQFLEAEIYWEDDINAIEILRDEVLLFLRSCKSSHLFSNKFHLKCSS